MHSTTSRSSGALLRQCPLSRRRFLGAAAGTVGGALSAELLLPIRAWADDENLPRFVFEVVSGDGNTADRINLSGAGTFGIGVVTGGGSFTRFTPTGTAPFPIVNSGTWRARTFLSFTETPGSPYGQGISGILSMEVELRPLGIAPVAATMQVICNLGAGALDTGEEEGVKLALRDGTTFAPIGQGQTIFNLGHDD